MVRWTQAMDEVLRTHYRVDLQAKEIAFKLGLPSGRPGAKCVERRAQRLGLNNPLGRRAWSDEENAYIREKWATTATYKIAEALHRSFYSVVSRAFSMGLRRANEGYSCELLGQCFGTGKEKVLGLISTGRLVAKYSDVGRTHFEITNESVEAYVLHYLNEVDFRRVDQAWLKGILAGLLHDKRINIEPMEKRKPNHSQIVATFKKTNGDVLQTAFDLGISVRSVYRHTADAA